MANCLYTVLCGRVVTHWNHDENFKKNRNVQRAFCGDCTSDNRYRRRTWQSLTTTVASIVTAVRFRWYCSRRAGTTRWRRASIHRSWLRRLLACSPLSPQVRQDSGVSTARAFNKGAAETVLL